ncbi:hypothetical protein Fcan01_00537 [Folsomia candida]|uniref:Uncharacterized protein n=1 Tax=Folsomia candida TaxID=158441 RepID=A0A226F6D9_FOLCA|nr:hypothetical protein Fcan01_00537 [Folsomia candida]
MRTIQGLLLFLLSFLRVDAADTNYHESRPHCIKYILKHIGENFEIQIFSDRGMTSEEFPLTYSSPTTIIYSTTLNLQKEKIFKEAQYSLNIYRTRFQPYKTSLNLLQQFLKIPTPPSLNINVSFHKNFVRLTEAATVDHYYFKDMKPILTERRGLKLKREYIKSTRNTFLFLATFLTKSDLHTIKFVPHYILDYELENFAFINLLPRQNNHTWYEMCAVIAGKDPAMNTTQCKLFQSGDNSSVMQNFLKMRILFPTSPIWSFSDKFNGAKWIFLIQETDILNPFDRNVNLYAPWYIGLTILKRSNASLTRYGGQDRLVMFAEENIVELTGLYEVLHQVAMTKWRGFQFVSCYSHKYISFSFYITPFQPATWYFILLSLVSTISAVSIYMKIYARDVSPSFSPWLSFFAMLLEDSVTIPAKLAQSGFYRSIFTHWGPVAVLLSNCYTGLMITELNAPLKGWRPESFEDLVCDKSHRSLFQGIHGVLVNKTVLKFNARKYSINISRDEPKPNSMDNSGLSVRDECFNVLSIPEKSKLEFAYEHPYPLLEAELATDYYFQIAYSSEQTPLTKDRLIQYIIYETMPIFPRRFLNRDRASISLMYPEIYRKHAEEEVANCEKSVFVGNTDTVKYEMKHLTRKYPGKKFIMGKKTMDERMIGWTFRGNSRSAVRRNFYGIVESGIYKILEEETYSRMYLYWGKNKVVNKTELQSNVEIQS